MRILETVADLQRLADAERAAGRRIALVPTMGALHAGHLSLVKEAHEHADCVWVSIFVNPTQFDDLQDLSSYPRSLAADLEACELAGGEAAGVAREILQVVELGRVHEDRDPDAVGVLGEKDHHELLMILFPEHRDVRLGSQQQLAHDGRDPAKVPRASDSRTAVDVSGLCEPLCGGARPGHFRGVTTIVSKLLLAAKPHVAVFGEKDHQQLVVIRRMVRDLGFGVEIIGAATLREADGLAMSSRNANLDPEARRQAVALVRALDAAEAAASAGESDRDALLALARSEIARAPLARVDYVELCDPDSLARSPSRLAAPALLALAVFFEPGDPERGSRVRLIDNRVLPVEPELPHDLD